MVKCRTYISGYFTGRCVLLLCAVLKLLNCFSGLPWRVGIGYYMLHVDSLCVLPDPMIGKVSSYLQDQSHKVILAISASFT